MTTSTWWSWIAVAVHRELIGLGEMATIETQELGTEQAGWLAEPLLQRLLAALAAAGGEGRVVGGAVRNALLGLAISDIDIATTLLPEAVTAAAKGAGFSVHPTGIEHGTVTVVGHLGERTAVFEVTTLRRDVETDGRRAVVEFTDQWALDAERRDLTINALYCDAGGQVHDHVGGLADIAAGRVRFVGDAGRRIEEDYLRILRFFRFHAWYGKGRPDDEGLKACVAHKAGLKRLSRERIGGEFLKLLAAPGALGAIRLMVRHGIVAELIDAKADPARLGRVIAIERALGLKADPVRRLAGLFASANASLMQDALRLSIAQTRRLQHTAESSLLSPALHEQERKVLLYRMMPQPWRDAVVAAWTASRAPADSSEWRSLFELPGHWRAPKFPITGNDLIAAGMAPGEALGETLQRLEDEWLARGFAPGRTALLEQAKSLGLG